MGTPEDRLRQKAQALEADRARREEMAKADERAARADLQQRAQAAATEAQKWLDRARELVAATGMRVPYQMDYHLDQGPGFELTVGTAKIRLLLEPDGWHVRLASPADLYHQQALPVDPAGMRETVLEQMVGKGLEDLTQGRVPPGPDWGR